MRGRNIALVLGVQMESAACCACCRYGTYSPSRGTGADFAERVRRAAAARQRQQQGYGYGWF